MNSFKRWKGEPKDIKNLKLGTLGYPKFRKKYGYGVNRSTHLLLNNRYMPSNVGRRGRITEFYWLFTRNYSVESQPINIINRLNNIVEVSSKYSQNRLNVKLYSLLYDKELYYIAYNQLKSKIGNMTPALEPTTLDGLSEDWINEIIISLKNESFKFKPARKVKIPKPKGGFRVLSIAGPRDKIVQEAIRIILEAVFDPIFSKDSHGFRKQKSCHSALYQIKNEFQVARWIINCDIVQFFDNIEHPILMNILKKRISDHRMLNLIQKYLNSGYGFDSRNISYNLIEIPQGGVLSPLLSNIILNELDNYILLKKNQINKGLKPKINPEYLKIKAKKDWAIKKGNIKKILLYKNELLKLNYYNENNSEFRRLIYVRYADDFVIGFRGPYAEAKCISIDINNFLQNELNLLSTSKVLNLTTDSIKFLGTIIHLGGVIIQSITKQNNVSSSSYKRRINKRLLLFAPLKDIKYKLIKHNFINKNSEIIPKFIWIHRPIKEIIELYNSVLRGILNYYSFVNNRGDLVSLLWNTVQFSCAKLLAAKMKLKTSRQVFKKYGQPINFEGSFLYKPSYSKIIDLKKQFNLKNWQKVNPIISGLVANYKSMARLDNLSCNKCGSTYKVEMHHIKHMKNVKNKKGTIAYLMSHANRKQIPLCSICHRHLHSTRK
jgi:nicotine oxidoreductase